MADVATRLLTDDSHLTFQLAVHADGELVVDVAAGAGYDDDSRPLHLQASATKGVAGVALALALQDADVRAEEPVARFWPEFAARGKEGVTIAQLMSHQVGLLDTTGRYPLAAWGGDRAVAADLAAQAPAWVAGAGHGYHALSIGPLADELVRRLVGRPLIDQYEDRVRGSGDVDFWIRLPREQYHRLNRVHVPTQCPAQPLKGLADLALGRLDAAGPGNTWIQSHELLEAGAASVSGAGSALGLSQVYARAIGADGIEPLLRPDVVADVSQLRTSGPDLVLGVETGFAVLFQKPSPRYDFGTEAAFGHDGAGGALGFADPGTGVAVGFTTPEVPVPAGADTRALIFAQLVRRLRL
ncbi:serine hydrolase domain-containing protein [Quadrisphaera sp. INWT6]|uniref:serine hydrolase domain-containing protein n=1 Tax=Quadrisphaera sp. INWT6 TaxID=2596917 RepID=UPI0018924E8F|nr:serine hydrolase domain-containing protein [Quadrisphaera sp. INWT6]